METGSVPLQLWFLRVLNGHHSFRLAIDIQRQLRVRNHPLCLTGCRDAARQQTEAKLATVCSCSYSNGVADGKPLASTQCHWFATVFVIDGDNKNHSVSIKPFDGLWHTSATASLQRRDREFAARTHCCHLAVTIAVQLFIPSMQLSCWVRFNVPLDTLWVISGTIFLQVWWPKQQRQSTEGWWLFIYLLFIYLFIYLSYHKTIKKQKKCLNSYSQFWSTGFSGFSSFFVKPLVMLGAYNIRK